MIKAEEMFNMSNMLNPRGKIEPLPLKLVDIPQFEGAHMLHEVVTSSICQQCLSLSTGSNQISLFCLFISDLPAFKHCLCF